VKVLIIEDDVQVVRDIRLCLKLRYPDIVDSSVDKVSKGIEMIETESPDFVIADSSLPDTDLIEAIGTIREFSDVPLTILSEAETDMDKARFLEAGADEYITKPISCMECLSVINALLRRTKGIGFKPGRTVSIDEQLKINFDTRELLRSGKHIHLTPTEYNLLSTLVRNSGIVLSQRTLLEKVWGSNYTNDLSLLKKHIYRLRSKLEPEPSRPRIIVTERGFGYKLVKQL